MIDDVFSRQIGIIAPDRLTMPILIVGAGSVGGWSALALSKLGCSNLSVMDGDSVEVHNAGSQIYKSSDEGELKVDSLAEKIDLLTETSLVSPISNHWTPDINITSYPIVISAVDSITTRSQLFQATRLSSLFIDARMAGNSLEIYTVRGGYKEDEDAYRKTLFAEDETLPIPCSERAVVYNVFICAGLIADLIARFANGQELPKELIMDLYNFTLFK